MNRFYSSVSVEPEEGDFRVLLDGKPIKTRAGFFLRTPNIKVAEQIRQEWVSQKGDIVPDSMPFTQILSTKLDRVERARDIIILSVLKYIDTDLLCYIADEPEGLRVMQQQRRDPFRLWFASYYGQSLKVTKEVQAISQPAELHEAVKRDVQRMCDDDLTVLSWATGLGGSLVMALGFLKKKFGAQEVYEGHYVEEDYKNGILREKNESYLFDDPVRKQALLELQALQQYMTLLEEKDS